MKTTIKSNLLVKLIFTFLFILSFSTIVCAQNGTTAAKDKKKTETVKKENTSPSIQAGMEPAPAIKIDSRERTAMKAEHVEIISNPGTNTPQSKTPNKKK
jgi:hypothetical protein